MVAATRASVTNLSHRRLQTIQKPEGKISRSRG
uniref:Uncharacterized protein n=1 Tax=Arundo donax TaxID=35708 RepID=A0A0A8XUJ3_ARUDO